MIEIRFSAKRGLTSALGTVAVGIVPASVGSLLILHLRLLTDQEARVFRSAVLDSSSGAS